MNKTVPIVLWLLVLFVGGIAVYFSIFYGTPEIVIVDETGKPMESQSGIVYADVKWEHLQAIPPFQFTNQLNEEFDSAELGGRPLVVSFFFAQCPTICRDLNRQVQTLREQLNDAEMMFATISVDPERDTPAILEKYAEDFGASTEDWNFLTGELYKVKQLGSLSFNAIIDQENHTDNIFLIDRWGRFRDRFIWNDPDDMKRFLNVAKEVLAEKAPPFGKTVNTRNVTAGVKPVDIDAVPWIKDFHLTDQDDQQFYSRDLIGETWICSFFFVACPGICVEQNQYLAGLQGRMSDNPTQIVSISTDPNQDKPERLRQYARKMNADLNSWKFLTGDENLIKRVGAEYFKAYASGGHHSTMLFVVDRWGNVRGEFDWREPAAEIQMKELIESLNGESVPPSRFERISVQQEPEADDNESGH